MQQIRMPPNTAAECITGRPCGLLHGIPRQSGCRSMWLACARADLHVCYERGCVFGGCRCGIWVAGLQASVWCCLVFRCFGMCGWSCACCLAALTRPGGVEGRWCLRFSCLVLVIRGDAFPSALSALQTAPIICRAWPDRAIAISCPPEHRINRTRI